MTAETKTSAGGGLIGLLAGDGNLPVAFARAARRFGRKVFAVGLSPGVQPSLADEVACFERIPITKWDAVVRALVERGVRDVVVLGKVSKTLLFVDRSWDERFARVIRSAPDARDDQLLLAFTADLASEGVIVCDQTELLPELFPGPAFLTKRRPDEREWRDIAFGFRMAKGIGGLDIGQTVVVKELAVLAVEAIEGTDEAILRGGALGRGGAVVVKVAKPQQDLRFDVPTVGPQTVRVMRQCGATTLAFEARRTFVVDEATMLAAAEEAGIAVVAFEEGMRLDGGRGTAHADHAVGG